MKTIASMLMGVVLVTGCAQTEDVEATGQEQQAERAAVPWHLVAPPKHINKPPALDWSCNDKDPTDVQWLFFPEFYSGAHTDCNALCTESHPLITAAPPGMAMPDVCVPLAEHNGAQYYCCEASVPHSGNYNDDPYMQN